MIGSAWIRAGAREGEREGELGSERERDGERCPNYSVSAQSDPPASVFDSADSESVAEIALERAARR